MTPEKHENFAENLRNLRAARNLSMTEFAKALDIPKYTLQAILEDGQTTLNTALRISEKLSVALDILTCGSLTAEHFEFISKKTITEDGEYVEAQSFFQIKKWFLEEFSELKKARKEYREKVQKIYEAESQFFDRKSARIAPKDFAHQLSAFANASGGIVVIGIEDDGQITGVTADNENTFRQVAFEFLQAPPEYQIEVIPCVLNSGMNGNILLFHISPSANEVIKLKNGDACGIGTSHHQGEGQIRDA